MKFYWFMRHNEYDIKKTFKDLEESGFDGVLLAYAQMGDPFSALANSIDKESKMEYIVAVRPWLISPQYVSQIVKSFNDFAPGRLSLNIVPGNILDSEKDYNGILGEIDDKSSQEDRRLFLTKWIDQYQQYKTDSNKVYVSGHHADIVENSYKVDALIMNYFVYKNDNLPIPPEKSFYLSMSPVIGGNPRRTSDDNIVVSPEELYTTIKSLESMGVEGVFFHNTYSQQISYLMDFVKEYKGYGPLCL